MSAPADVTLYYIYKAGLRVGDDNLAITFQGVDQPVTVEKLVFDSTQIVCIPTSLLSSLIFSLDYYCYLQWMVEYSEFVPGVQAILPISDLTLQATWGDNDSVNVSWSIESYWIIEKADNGYMYVTRTSWPHFVSSFSLIVS